MSALALMGNNDLRVQVASAQIGNLAKSGNLGDNQ